MLKYLLLIGIGYGIYYFYFKKKTISTSKNNHSQELKDNDMVECVTCKTYVEINVAIISNGKYFCSKECLEQSR